MAVDNASTVLEKKMNVASEILSEAISKTKNVIEILTNGTTGIQHVAGASVVVSGGGNQTLGEPLSTISYLSVFIPHFIGKPAENREILRKLYLDFDLSSYQISEITGWPRTTVSEFFNRENIIKVVKKSSTPRFGERTVGGIARVPHQNEQKIIQKILALKSTGNSFREIANTLNASGLYTKKSCKWTISTVYEMYRREQEKQK